MQLSIRDLTHLLAVSESAIHQWIKQRALPARQVGGWYHVNRSELLEWATTNRIQVSAELFDYRDAGGEGARATCLSLTEALEAGGIHYQLPNTTDDRGLRALVQVLPLPDDVDRELLLQLFLAREAAASTAIGDGIALPHVRNPIVLQVPRPTITLAFLKNPVDFGASDGKPVHVLFTIISPTARCHLQLLSRLSMALHDRPFRETVIHQSPREEILRELLRIESGLDAAASEARP